eukprot:TRINITY_DN2902_c0_g1_i10.p6 TRINITY_DN2902_c0_g1~~TRINITY_DN2902_c0_g1_i10.p6  ORF type:complete len:111 (+),score=31.32 TRINITY_DN2902_c0_g1_i10:694-1026(+)
MNINDINEGNMLQFMSVIEKRTNEILQMYSEVFGNPNAQQKDNNAHESMERKRIEEQNAIEFQKIIERVQNNEDKSQDIKEVNDIRNESKQEVIKVLGKNDQRKNAKRRL